MCQRCKAINQVMREATDDTSLKGAGNIVAQLAQEFIVLGAKSLNHLLPESMFDASQPYKQVAELMTIVAAGLEFELTVPIEDLPHDAPAAPAVDNTPFNTDAEIAEPAPDPTPIRKTIVRKETPAPDITEEDRKLMAEGDDILKDMLGEGNGPAAS